MNLSHRITVFFALIVGLFANIAHAQTTRPYILRPGDLVQIQFFYNPELNQEAQIRPDGGLSFALIGDLQLSGKTPASVAGELEGRYANILKKPAVTVQVKNFGGLRVYVGGEVNRPGTLSLASSETILDAVLDAGGAKHTAGEYVLLIRRGPDGTATLQRIPANAVAGNGAPATASFALQSFDVLLVPESRIARVNRWVDQYVRQMIPGTLSGGFSYLVNGINGNIIP